MKILRTAACGLIAALLLVACGNATAGMAFKVPPGYQSKMNLFGMEMWINSAVPPSMIMLVTIPKKFDISKAGDFTFTDLPNNSVKDTRVTEHEKITMCGNQPAYKASAIGTQDAAASPAPGSSAAKTSKSADEDMDMIVTGWGGKTYMAMYMHPYGQPADVASEAALKTLCPAAS